MSLLYRIDISIRNSLLPCSLTCHSIPSRNQHRHPRRRRQKPGLLVSKSGRESRAAPKGEGGRSYESTDVHPIRVSFPTGCALHLESVEVRLLFGVEREQVGDAGWGRWGYFSLSARNRSWGRWRFTPLSRRLGSMSTLWWLWVGLHFGLKVVRRWRHLFRLVRFRLQLTT